MANPSKTVSESTSPHQRLGQQQLPLSAEPLLSNNLQRKRSSMSPRALRNQVYGSIASGGHGNSETGGLHPFMNNIVTTPTSIVFQNHEDLAHPTTHLQHMAQPPKLPRPILQFLLLRDGIALGLDHYYSVGNVLLLAAPFGALSGLLGWRDDVTFLLCFIGIIPLAIILSKATEDVAEHTNQTIGALVNVTFGNAVEIILSIAALRASRPDLVRNTLVGSILSNLLLVMGSSIFAGGLNFKMQPVRPAVAEANSDMLSFAVFALCIPTLYARMPQETSAESKDFQHLSVVTAFCLLLIYVLYLTFQLHTHAEFYEDLDGLEEEERDEENAMFSNVSGAGPDVRDSNAIVSHPSRPTADEGEGQASVVSSLPFAVSVIAVTVLVVGMLSEFLVGSLKGFSKGVGLSESFISIILLPFIGNAVEHISAVIVAYHGKIDLAIGIACGSSVQIALFAAPVLVIASWLLPGSTLTLDFGLFSTVAIGISVFVVNVTLRDTMTNWLEGAILVMCYVILSSAYYFMPH